MKSSKRLFLGIVVFFAAISVGFIVESETVSPDFVPVNRAIFLSRMGNLLNRLSPNLSEPTQKLDTSFSDFHPEAGTAEADALTTNVMQGFPDGSFRPKVLVSKGEAITMLSRLLEHLADRMHPRPIWLRTSPRLGNPCLPTWLEPSLANLAGVCRTLPFKISELRPDIPCTSGEADSILDSLLSYFTHSSLVAEATPGGVRLAFNDISHPPALEEWNASWNGGSWRMVSGTGMVAAPAGGMTPVSVLRLAHEQYGLIELSGPRLVPGTVTIADLQNSNGTSEAISPAPKQDDWKKLLCERIQEKTKEVPLKKASSAVFQMEKNASLVRDALSVRPGTKRSLCARSDDMENKNSKSRKNKNEIEEKEAEEVNDQTEITDDREIREENEVKEAIETVRTVAKERANRAKRAAETGEAEKIEKIARIERIEETESKEIGETELSTEAPSAENSDARENFQDERIKRHSRNDLTDNDISESTSVKSSVDSSQKFRKNAPEESVLETGSEASGGSHEQNAKKSVSGNEVLVTGYVIDESTQKRLEGATILAGTINQTTDRNGYFRVCGLPNQLLEFTVYCDGYETRSLRHRVRRGSGALVLSLKERLGLLEGRIEDISCERGIRGALVEIDGRTIRTDSDGTFRVSGLQPTWHQVTVRAKGYMDTVELVFVKSPSAHRVIRLRGKSEEKAASPADETDKELL
ncbi:MAG: carboxypeptidase regulatory-like domain-containing protein [Candidatus Ozemobacteraceae bacterium]